VDTCRTPIPDRVTGMPPRSEGYGVNIVLIIVGPGTPFRNKTTSAQRAFPERVSGRSNSTRPCITLDVIRPRSHPSRRIRPSPAVVFGRGEGPRSASSANP
jgi:hypothetical protein